MRDAMFRRALALLLILAFAIALVPPSHAQEPAAVKVRMLDGAPTAAFPGDTLVFPFEVHNPSSSNLTVHLDANESTGRLHPGFPGFPWQTLPPYGTVLVNVTLWAPSDAAPGSYELRLDARPDIGNTRSMASLTWFVTIEPTPLWSLDAFSSGAARGEETEVNVTITNGEPADIVVALAARELDGRLDVALDETRLYVPSGQNVSTTLRAHVPTDDSDRAYRLRITATREGTTGAALVVERFLFPSSFVAPKPTPMPPARGGSFGGDPNLPFFVTPAADYIFGELGSPLRVPLSVDNRDPSIDSLSYRVREVDGRLSFGAPDGALATPQGHSSQTITLDMERPASGDYRLALEFWPAHNKSALQAATIGLRVTDAPPAIDTERPPPRPDLGARPEEAHVEVPQGGERTAWVTVRHTGAGTLRFTFTATGTDLIVADAPPGPRSAAPGEEVRVPILLRAETDAAVGTRGQISYVVLPAGGGTSARGTIDVTVVEAAAAGAPSVLHVMGAFVQAYPLASGSLAVAGAALATIPLWRREWWRYLMALPLLPLYTRLQKRDVLTHKVRERISQLIAGEPGIHYSALKTATGLNAGALVHHLRTLERHGLVTSRREGILRRFYPVGARLPPPPADPLTPTQQRILDMLSERPMTQRELASALGVTQQGVSYHVKTLERKGKLLLERDGGEWRYHRVHELDVEAAA